MIVDNPLMPRHKIVPNLLYYCHNPAIRPIFSPNCAMFLSLTVNSRYARPTWTRVLPTAK